MKTSLIQAGHVNRAENKIKLLEKLRQPNTIKDAHIAAMVTIHGQIGKDDVWLIHYCRLKIFLL